MYYLSHAEYAEFYEAQGGEKIVAGRFCGFCDFCVKKIIIP
jgi:hypothetical protein